jgi:hypothetical protein
MHKQTSFPLRIAEEDRRRAKRLADKVGLSENRLYSDLIHGGLLLREQMAYFGYRVMKRSVLGGLHHEYGLLKKAA